MPKVSVVIPCYNQGIYLEETVDSVLAQTFDDYEIVIVNDGSTDAFTNRLLGSFSKPRTRVIHTANQGVSTARNTGIESSSGRYILPLDADDLIGGNYLQEAVAILDDNAEIGIVTCLLEFFGAKNYRPVLAPFSLDVMLTRNELGPCSSFFRREDWQRAGGFNPNMKQGWEDWDFWLSLLELEVTVYRIPAVHFYYRILNNSRERSMGKEDHLRMYMQLYENHPGLYVGNMTAVFREICDYHELLASNRYKYARFLEDPRLLAKGIVEKIQKLLNSGGSGKN